MSDEVKVDDKVYVFGGVTPHTLDQPIQVLDHGYVKYIEHMGTDLTPLECARMSTGNETGVDEQKDNNLREYLWKNRHSSPFEFCELHIEVQAPIFVFRQWMRHRTQVFNEASGRYSVLPDLFYVPEESRVKGRSKTNKQGSEGVLPKGLPNRFVTTVADEQICARSSYEGWVDDGVANELARINLPLSQYSKMRAKANLRNWLHFLTLRLDSHAQEEIRVYGQAVQQIIQMLWPKIWEVFEEHTLYAQTFSRTEVALLARLLEGDGVSKLTGLAVEAGWTEAKLQNVLQKFSKSVLRSAGYLNQ